MSAAGESTLEAPQHEVAIIGAGLSGIGMAIALRRAGIEDFVVLERAEDVGGTWRDNTYPGIGVDIPAQAYQFSYELKPDWSGVYASGAEVKAYVDQCVERHGIRPFVRFGSEVLERVWDAAAQLWRLHLAGGETHTARYVVSAIGPFVDPKPAAIEGLDEFQGKLIESARWDHEYDLTGKRVAIIGTGASAVQIVPEIARVVEHLDVYQRTPIWVGPKWNPPTPAAVKALYRRVPIAQRIAREFSAGLAEFVLIFMILNHRRIPFVMRGFQDLLGRFYRAQVPDPELRAKLTPNYGFGCKRPAVSNHYLRTFMRDNVELVCDPIERVTATGVQTERGEQRDVDALILATGFRLASDPENFRRTPVRGRDGFDLATFYEETRLESYEGISMPRLPNHFMMFGPYGWTGGTWHALVETTSTHIVRVIREAARRGAHEVEVRQDAADRWTSFVRERLAQSLWHHNACGTANSYYFDHHGDTPFLRPTSSLQARRASRSFPLEDYRFTPARAGRGSRETTVAA
ncbi:MAG: flavin-containing monooxygenase [Solirubrobacteraceae bacterium]